MIRRAALLLVAAATIGAGRVPIPASDLLLVRHDASIDFEWTAAAQAATQPALLAQLRVDAQAQLARVRREAAEDRKSRGADFPFHKHYFEKDWARAAETPQLLVLTATIDSFSGGAHGMQTFDVAVWDKAAGKRLTAAALFTDWPRARALLTKDYCAALDDERKQRRGGETPALKEFGDCPAIDKQVIVPSGDVQGRIVILKVRIAPYEAGPYAEGSYEIEVGLSKEVIALVKPIYRAAFGWAED